MKKLHALMRVIYRDPVQNEALTFMSMGWASADSILWSGACAIRISEDRCIVRMGTGLIVRMSLKQIPNSDDDSYVVSNDIKD